MSKIYILVHGLFHGGWCWKRVEDRLRAAGHEQVYTPTLTGLGERSHLLSGDIGLGTFIDDVVNLIEYEEITDVILVGHSFGGMVITGVADAVPGRIRHIVYLDAFVPRNGQSAFSQLPVSEMNARMARARDHDGGVSIPPSDPGVFGVTDPADVAWLKRRLTPHPVKTCVEPIALTHPPAHNLKRTYIRCIRPLYEPAQPTADWLQQQPGWNYIELVAGHDAQVTAPVALTDILLKLD